MKNDDYPPSGPPPKRSAVREPRPVDIHEREVVAGADHFTATSFLGGGRYEIVNASSLEEAKEAAREMLERRDPRNLFSIGRPILIYAVKGVHSVVAELVHPQRRKR